MQETPQATGEGAAQGAAASGGPAIVLDTKQLCREWGWIALRGLLSIIFGVMVLAWPLATIWALAIIWGAFAFADGISAGIAGWRLYKRGVRWWPYIIFAVIGILAGIVAFVWPGITALTLMLIIGVWAVVGGVSQIIAAFRLRKEIEGEWFLAFAGLVSVLFGALLLFRPLPEGVLMIAWIVSFYAFVTGVLYIMLAFKLRQKAVC